MRGKNIIWLSLIALLLGTFLTGVEAQTPTPTVFMDPSSVAALPGDIFDIQIMIANGSDIYAWGFDIQVEPLERMITAIGYTEGPYLQGIGVETYFQTPAYDKNTGLISMGCSRLGPVAGANGDGLLATVTFQVLEAGNSPLDLLSTKLIDSLGNLVEHTAIGCEYSGPTLDLYKYSVVPWWRWMRVGNTGTFKASVKSYSTVPLYGRVRWDLVRTDGAMYNLYAGQNAWTEAPPSVYLYVNDFTGHYGEGWGYYYEGAAPYLNAVGDGNYVWTDAAGMEEGEYPGYYPYTGRYDFEDLDLAGRAISGITIEAYTRYEYYDDSNDLDTYMRAPGEAPPSVWVGSLWGDETWGWHTVRWTTDLVSDALPALVTQDGINAARVRFIMYWTADDLEHGEVYIDALRLKVDFSPVSPVDPPWVVVEPGATVQMPDMIYHWFDNDIGIYTVTVWAEFRYYEPPPPGYPGAVVWNRGAKVKTFKILVWKPPTWWPFPWP